MRKNVLLLAVVAGVCCTGTPVPIPTPIDSRMVHLSSPVLGEVVIVGLPGAVSRGSSVIGSTQTFSSSSKITSVGSFAMTLTAEVSSDIELVVKVDSEDSESLSISVPEASGHPTPKATAGPSQKGQVSISGTASAGDKVIVALPRTGAVAVVAANSKGGFIISIPATSGDRIHLFSINAKEQTSQHSTLVVGSQTVVPPCTDVDGDGWGATGSDLRKCKNSTTKEDCDDTQKDVHPGQQTYFSVAIPGSSSFDYNCDGKDDKEYDALENCAKSVKCADPGWLTTVPACGQTGNWVQCVMNKTCMAGTPTARTQKCL